MRRDVRIEDARMLGLEAAIVVSEAKDGPARLRLVQSLSFPLHHSAWRTKRVTSTQAGVGSESGSGLNSIRGVA
jgi:hypothetical protein